MTKSTKQAPQDDRSGQSFYSKDYWDIVFEQLGKRKLFRVSIAIMVLLYASAIYAPLIANDKPYSLDAINYKDYKSATSLLSATTSSMGRLLKQTPEEYLANRNEEAPESLDDALDLEREALALKVGLMKQYLAPADHAELDGLLAEVDGILPLARAGDYATAIESIEATKKKARALKKDYKALLPADLEADPTAEGKLLISKKSYPLWASLSPFVVYMMILWLIVMTWPVWNRLVNGPVLGGDRERIRAARRSKIAFTLLTPLAVALAWLAINGPGGGTFDVSPYKAGLTSGDIIAIGEPSFPPLAMGYAEIHSEESFRPPTWTSNAEISEEGYYVRGYRVPEPDLVTGYMPEPQPVEVRYGEKPRNAPSRHLMGTDESGRDFLVRLIWGGR